MFTKIKNYLLIIMLAGMSLMALVFFIVALIYPTLPNVSHLQQYRPKEPLQIFSQEGLLIAEFGEERRDQPARTRGHATRCLALYPPHHRSWPGSMMEHL